MTVRFHHVAFLVEDLDAAIAHFGLTMGLTFRPPIVPGFPRLRDRYGYEGPGGDERITYSTTGPMHVELMQASGEGIWSRRHLDGVHHLGLFTPDVASLAGTLRASGYEWEGEVRLENGGIAGMFLLSGGRRYEVLDSALLAPLTDWIEGRTEHPARNAAHG